MGISEISGPFYRLLWCSLLLGIIRGSIPVGDNECLQYIYYVKLYDIVEICNHVATDNEVRISAGYVMGQKFVTFGMEIHTE